MDLVIIACMMKGLGHRKIRIMKSHILSHKSYLHAMARCGVDSVHHLAPLVKVRIRGIDFKLTADNF